MATRGEDSVQPQKWEARVKQLRPARLKQIRILLGALFLILLGLRSAKYFSTRVSSSDEVALAGGKLSEKIQRLSAWGEWTREGVRLVRFNGNRMPMPMSEQLLEQGAELDVRCPTKSAKAPKGESVLDRVRFQDFWGNISYSCGSATVRFFRVSAKNQEHDTGELELELRLLEGHQVWQLKWEQKEVLGVLTRYRIEQTMSRVSGDRFERFLLLHPQKLK